MSTIKDLIGRGQKGFVIYRGMDGAAAHGFGKLYLTVLFLEEADRYAFRSKHELLNFEWQATLDRPESGWYGEHMSLNDNRNWAPVLDKIKLADHILREIFKKVGQNPDHVYMDDITPYLLLDGMMAAGYTRFVTDDREHNLVAYEDLLPDSYEAWSEGYEPREGENNPSKFQVMAITEDEAQQKIMVNWPVYLNQTTRLADDYDAYKEWMVQGRPVWSMTQRYWKANGWGSFQPPTRRESDPVANLLNIENPY